MEITSEIILGLLKQRYRDRQWSYFPEMVFSTKAKSDNEQADSRIDFWVMNLWGSRKYERISFEIKISRHDLLRELRKPEKREPGLRISNTFYYIMPDGCCEISDIPPECGLLVIKKPKNADYYILSMVKRAPWRDIKPELGVDFWASLARRLATEEGNYDKEQYNRREAQLKAKEKQNADSQRVAIKKIKKRSENS